MFNVGTAKGTFIIDGLQKSVKNLQDFVKTLSTLSKESDMYYSKQKKVLEGYRLTNPQIAKMITGENNFAGALRRANVELNERYKKLTQIRAAASRETNTAARAGMQGIIDAEYMPKAMRGFQQTMPMGALGTGFGGYATQMAAATTNMAKFAIETVRTHSVINSLKMAINALSASTINLGTNLKTRLTSALNPPIQGMQAFRSASGQLSAIFSIAGNKLTNLSSKIRNHTEVVKAAEQASTVWWKRFGQVAVGFSIAYRLINAVENVIRNVTQAFREGISIADQYRAGIAQTAGMLALLSKGLSGYNERYERFKQIMRGTMFETYRQLPELGLDITEVLEGYKELAQFGVVVTRDIVGPTMNAIAVIKEIASTTGSTSKQVRQELQAVFSNSTRISDQFFRTVKLAMPDVYEAIKNVSRLGGTSADKWQILMDKLKDYRIAIIESRQTISAQLEITRMGFKMISQAAVEQSGIYSTWLERIRAFNKELYQANGMLGEQGMKVYVMFYRSWQLINIITMTIARFVGYVIDVAKYIYNWSPTLTSFFVYLVKIRVVMFFIQELAWLAGKAFLFILKPVMYLAGGLGKVFGILGGVFRILALKISLWDKIRILAAASKIQVLAYFAGLKKAAGAALILAKNMWLALVPVMKVGLAIVGAFAAGYTAGSLFYVVITGIMVALDQMLKRLGKVILTLTNFKKLFTNPVQFFKDAWNVLVEAGTAVTDGFVDGLKKGWHEAIEGGKLLLSTMKSTFGLTGDLVGGAFDAAKSSFSWFDEKFKNLFPELAAGFGDIPEFKIEDFGKPDLSGIEFPPLSEDAEKDAKKLKDAYEKALKELNDLFKDWANTQKGLMREMAVLGMDEFDKQLFELDSKVDDIYSGIMDKARELDWKTLFGTREQFDAFLVTFHKRVSTVLGTYRKTMAGEIERQREINKLLREREVIARHIADVEDSYENYLIDTKELLTQKVQLLQYSYDIAKQQLAMTPVTDQRYLEYFNLVQDLYRQIKKEQTELMTYSASFMDGFSRGLAKYTRDLKNNFDSWSKMSEEVAKTMQDSFEDFFLSALEGDLQSFEDFFTNFGKNLNKILARMLAEMTMRWIAAKLAWETGIGGMNIFSNGAGGFMGTLSQLGGLAMGFFGGGGSSLGGSGGYSLGGASKSVWDSSNWSLLGHKEGGLLTEPIIGVGKSGNMYSFVEDGKPERVLSNKDTRNYGNSLSISVPVNVQNGDNNFAAGLQRAIERTVEDYVRRMV